MSAANRDYPIQAIPLTQVSIQDKFWQPRIETAIKITIPYDFKKCEETGRIDNFSKAGGLMDGPHEGIFYNDSDVFKVVEGAAYALQVAPNSELEAYVDALIEKFAAAQEDDGYLYTARTIDPANPPERCGRERWSNLIVNHELYNVGHMYEAAVAYFQATGKRRFLELALRNADLIEAVFGSGKRRDVPGHQEIELALVRLYRVTRDEKYLRLAKFFLDERGQANERELYGDYCQDHLPVIQQTEAVGHAVRAAYMYASMADIAAATADADYVAAVQNIWDNVVSKKLALTGGIGARRHGEAFGADYELPALTGYNETCAAQANILWNHRLFLLTGEAKYIDILERSLYNGFLAGIGLDGKSFFYVNPLASDGHYRFNRDGAMTRQPWFQTSCCPTNIVRLLPSLSGYIYAVRGQDLYVNLYIASQGRVRLGESEITLIQSTDYPWDGTVQLDVSVPQPKTFTLKLRIPSFAQNQPLPSDLYRYAETAAEPVRLAVDGEELPLHIDQGYVSISRRWSDSARITLELPMPVRRVLAHTEVEHLRGKVALERGPIVYAIEAADNDADVLELALADSSQLETKHQPTPLQELTVIQGAALDAAGNSSSLTAIPYYVWGHRETGAMTVWLNRP